jgi:hypothetical protein
VVPVWFPTLADAGALIDEYVPKMVRLIDSPHLDNAGEWLSLRERIDALFRDHAWEADESRVAFDLLVAFAERESMRDGHI